MAKSKNHGTIQHVISGIFLVQILSSLIGIIGSVVDGMVIGRFLGEEAMAAFGFTNPVTLVVTIVASMLSTGASVLCGKYVGEGRVEKTREVFSACFSGALLISLLLASLTVASAPAIAGLAGAKDELLEPAADYIRGYGLACPGIILVSFLIPLLPSLPCQKSFHPTLLMLCHSFLICKMNVIRVLITSLGCGMLQ